MSWIATGLAYTYASRSVDDRKKFNQGENQGKGGRNSVTGMAEGRGNLGSNAKKDMEKGLNKSSR